MVYYECYRCGYSNSDKSKMRQHINRKNSCEPFQNNINLDECKIYILKGLTFKQYSEKKEQILSLGESTTKIPQNTTISPKITTKIPQNTTFSPKNFNFSPEITTKHKYECDFCKKAFSRYDSLNRHQKTCKEKKKEEEVKESMTELVKLLNGQLEGYRKELDKRDIDFKKELDKRDKQIDEQNKQIQELIKKAGINNNTINVQNNIKLLGYSDTDISHLTDNDILKCLNHSNFCIPRLIEKIHFDVNKPENHNVYISNLKNKYVMMYDGEKWNCKDRDDQINSLIDDIIFETPAILVNRSSYKDNLSNVRDSIKELGKYELRKYELNRQKQILSSKKDEKSKKRLKKLERFKTTSDYDFTHILIADYGLNLLQVAPLLPYYDIDPNIVQFMGTGVIDDKTFFYEPSLQGAIFPGIPETSRINIINNYMEIYDDEFLRISTLPYDLIGLINFIYTKKYKLGDVIRLLNNPNKKFDGIDGNFYFKDNMIERDLNILKINNGNSFVIN